MGIGQLYVKTRKTTRAGYPSLFKAFIDEGLTDPHRWITEPHIWLVEVHDEQNSTVYYVAFLQSFQGEDKKINTLFFPRGKGTTPAKYIPHTNRGPHWLTPLGNEIHQPPCGIPVPGGKTHFWVVSTELGGCIAFDHKNAHKAWVNYVITPGRYTREELYAFEVTLDGLLEYAYDGDGYTNANTGSSEYVK